MPQNLPLVKLSLLRPYANALRDRGLDPEPVFSGVGLSEEATLDPEMSVHVMVATQFVENAAEAAGDSFLAARIAAGLDLDGWPVLADAEARASTVGEYLNIFVSTANEVASSAVEYLHLDGPKATLGERRAFDPSILPAQNDAFMAGLGLSILRRALRDSMDPSQIQVVVSEPKALPPEFELMHPMKGDRSGFKLVFPSSWLFAPLEASSGTVTLNAAPHHSTPEFVQSFRQVVRAHFDQGQLTAGDCAELVSMSQQKLQRHLASFGTNISREIDVVRQETARMLLSTTERSIREIATELGYSDAANFTRAFRRAHNQAPTEFRKEAHGDQSDAE
ncbi:Transcriptional activator NphR [Roseovarius albus]|uniref:Transcriptional activator NphR n=1 Tax=Roseovarius albus TaxID=1247867 RepID=A0A1X6Y8D8_9RHOB|nr:AraC family transcriptional regulator [Roseovarius albus]SLN13447.1 Transcriptional activator NphR [Roseovarius albus]